MRNAMQCNGLSTIVNYFEPKNSLFEHSNVVFTICEMYLQYYREKKQKKNKSNSQFIFSLMAYINNK